MNHGALHGTACKGCRRRGRKCDRTLPTCLSCRRRGVECEYVTRWPGVAARGKLAGNSIPVVAKENPIASSKTGTTRVNQGSDQLANSSAESGHISNSLAQKNFSHPVVSSSANIDIDIERLVSHYIEDLSSIFYLGDGLSRNPMFYYVLPLVDTVPPVRYAIAASAASHIAARTSDKSLDQKSLNLRVQATHLLRERLRDPLLATDQSTLASILMLAQLDMCSGDCIEFETHLKAAVAIVRARQDDHASNRYYFEQRLAWLDIISSTTSTELPSRTVEELKTALGRFSGGGSRNWSYDVFPCPIDLCEILLDISVLYKTRASDGQPESDVAEEASRMMDFLQRWHFSEGGSESPREHMVEAWRLGIMTYLKRLFPSVENLGNTAITTAMLIRQVLDHAQAIPPATSWSYSLLWPIFQVGVMLEEKALDEKEWIRKHLKLALGSVGCRHFSNALETLEFVWANPSQRGTSTTGTFGRTIMLG